MLRGPVRIHSVIVLCILSLCLSFASAGQAWSAEAGKKSASKKKTSEKSGEKPYVTQKVNGFSELHSEQLSGRVTIQPGFTKARLLVDTADTKERCAGNVPSFTEEKRNGVDVLMGAGVLECTNGKAITMAWVPFNDKVGVIVGAEIGKETPALYVVYGVPKKESPTLLASLIEEVDPKSAYLASAPSGKVASEASAKSRKAPAQEEERGMGLGTGFFVSNDGLIVTNWHVVDGAKQVAVYLPGSRQGVPAEIVDRDPANDIAVLKVNVKSRGLPIYTGDVNKGEDVVVLGYPAVSLQGMEQKATFGRVNSLSGMQGDRRFFQIDAPLQPGNSGGPLLNHKGQVIGVVTATLNQDVAYKELGTLSQNVNYAVKTDYVNALLRGHKADMAKSDAATRRMKVPELIKSAEDSVVIVLSE